MDLHSQDTPAPYIHHRIKVVVLSFDRAWQQGEILDQHSMNCFCFQQVYMSWFTGMTVLASMI